MSQSETLNDDLFCILHDPKASKEIERSIQRKYLASDLDVSGIDLDSEEIIRTIANGLGYYFTEFVVMILMTTYLDRLKNGDGNDPEINIVKATDASGEKSTAITRILENLQSNIEPVMVESFLKDRLFITYVWEHFLRNLAGEIALILLDQNRDINTITKDEFLSVKDQCWQEILHQDLRGAAENVAFKYLQQLNPAEIPFQELQRIVRGGLDLLINISTTELRGIIGAIEKEITSEKNIVLRISGDGRRISIELPDMPKVSQETFIEMYSSLGRGGRRNVKVASLSRETKKALGKRYEELRDGIRHIKHNAKVMASVNNDWSLQIFEYYPVLSEHQDLLKHVDPYLVPEDANASEKILDPWEIAIEIAARETIPNYKKNSVSADILRQAAILSPYPF